MAFSLDVLQKYSLVMHRKVILKQQTWLYYTFERYFLAVNQITNGIHTKHTVKLNKYNVIITIINYNIGNCIRVKNYFVLCSKV